MRAKTQILLWVTIAIFSSYLSPSLAADKDDYVAEHNAWRAAVGAPPLEWDDALATLAQAHANELKNNNACNMEHSSTLGTEYAPGAMGENLYWASTSGTTLSKTPTDAVLGWAREIVDYNYGPVGDSCTQKDGAVVGHYTQMTWTDSRKLGCASASCDDAGGGKSGVWVCRYYPAGNYVNQYPFCGVNTPAGMSKCETLRNGGRPECGTPCGSCDFSATPSSCSASIAAGCLTEAGVGWDCSGTTCAPDPTAEGAGDGKVPTTSPAVKLAPVTWLATVMALLALPRLA